MRTALLTLALLAAGCQDAAPPVVHPAAGSAALLHGAIDELTTVMTHDIFSPPQASRIYAYTTVAAYEALVPSDSTLVSLAGQLHGFEPPPAPPAGVHGPTASLFAALAVGDAMTFSGESLTAYGLEAETRLRSLGVPARVVMLSRAHGEAVAQHVLAWSKKDGYARTRSGPAYSVTGEPGTWQPTPPAYIDAIEPNWGTLRTFVLDSAAQFKPPPPPPYSVEPGSAFRAQVDEVYAVSTRLTPEQRVSVSFWECNPYVLHTRGHAMFATKKLTPGGHWIGIAGIASRAAGDDAAGAAEAYVRTALVLADAFISTWDEKYRSRLARPETVINGGIDEAWEPMLQTPPFPEYPSGHAVSSAAASEALTALYGDRFAFIDSTEMAYGLAPRPFASFDAAAQEAAMSRLYGGIHYRMASEHGLVQGQGVGGLHTARVRTRTSGDLRAARRTRTAAGPSVATAAPVPVRPTSSR